MKRTIKSFFLLLLIISLTACGKTKILCLGGDIPKIDFLMEYGEKEHNFGIPLITNRAVEDVIELNGFETDNGADVDIKLNSAQYLFEYKGFCCFWLNMSIIDMKSTTPMRTKLTKLKLVINGEKVDYNLTDVAFSNIAYYEQKYGAVTTARDLLVSSDMTVKFNYWPSEKETFGRTFKISFSAEKELTFDRFYLLGNYLSIESFKANGKKESASNLNINMQKDAEVKLECGFARNSGVEEYNILCDTFVAEYTVSGQKNALVMNGGVQIWKNFSEVDDENTTGALRLYIDEKLTKK